MYPSQPTDTPFLRQRHRRTKYVYSVSSKCLQSLVFRLPGRIISMALGLPRVGLAPDVRVAEGRYVMRLLSALLVTGFLSAAVAPVSAQQGSPRDSAQKGRSAPIPADARPPKGMCRIWLDGVPAAQQPAATDCPTALKNRPSNGRVVFGDELADSSKRGSDKSKLPPAAKGFTGVSPVPPILPKKPPE